MFKLLRSGVRLCAALRFRLEEFARERVLKVPRTCSVSGLKEAWMSAPIIFKMLQLCVDAATLPCVRNEKSALC